MRPLFAFQTCIFEFNKGWARSQWGDTGITKLPRKPNTKRTRILLFRKAKASDYLACISRPFLWARGLWGGSEECRVLIVPKPVPVSRDWFFFFFSSSRLRLSFDLFLYSCFCAMPHVPFIHLVKGKMSKYLHCRFENKTEEGNRKRCGWSSETKECRRKGGKKSES